ncbi:hypothetical protein LEL_06254 [Akanthomyces lecanii RCEF 1005]|uniref:Uncharacterized protein n=1 Tax=Akanthomyces lecanii RCEF 1005 TaxID=1081108 RepID=A0A168GJP5_CORDF|nr:hypothetical protein LEL_06254 [Akanthomyces lecanii RCEF 1005]
MAAPSRALKTATDANRPSPGRHDSKAPTTHSSSSNVTITPAIDHRHGPQPQEIRTGRDRTLVERLDRMDLFDAPEFAANFEKVDAYSEALGCIERDLAVGLETEAGGAGHD